MCEIIVKAIDVTNPDPMKDQRGCYKRGYPVAVYPDGTRWGNEERLPKFVIIKLPGVPVDHPAVQKYVGEHREPRQATRKLNKLEYEERLAAGQYHPFLSAPTVVGETTEVRQVTVPMARWLKQVAAGKYDPFYTQPTIIAINGDDYTLEGTIVTVELQGDIITTITRRLWKIRFADLPLAARNKLATQGALTIRVGAYAGAYDYTWAQVKGYFRNQQTNLDETEDL